MDTYAAPTFTGEAPFITDESRFEALLDFDGDTTLDRLILFNDTNDGSVNIYDGSLTFLGTGTGALGATTEWFAPAALMPSFPATLSMLAVGKLDNGGLLAEDFIPDSGFLTPVIPEPGSMMLLGLGLMGGVISRRKRAVL
ncbi:MAG: PEP-CTERM sorting domain-containing protein [Candidatus Omnitrophica bacterium]|nr:PEP-CTERM sorting domain-containing protein [Candidatus Omnitrophota bacterium]